MDNPEPKTWRFPSGGWNMSLLDAIEQAQDGDTIAVHSGAMKELALSAIENRRQYIGPDERALNFIIEPPPLPF